MTKQNTVAEQEIGGQMWFMGLDKQACERIRSITAIIDRELPIGLDKFYEQVKMTDEVRSFFSSSEHMKHAKGAQINHWKKISSARFDDQYVESVQKIGHAHARIGLEPHWYICGYAVLMEHLIRAILAEPTAKGFLQRARKDASEEMGAAIGALVKAVMLDMDIAISVYLDVLKEERRKNEEATAAERELVATTIANGLRSLAAKDMTYRMNANLPEAYQRLQDDFNLAVQQVESALADVAHGAGSITSATHEIAAAADDLSSRTEQQAASLEETTAAVREITGAVDKTASGASQAHRLVSSAKLDAEKSGEIVRNAVEAMGRIEKSSQNIGQIITAIDEIAFQTNLLALNAGVEAARAGEAGRGFAVVASEVRALAQRSAEAAKEISALVAAATSEVSSGVSLVVDTGKALQRIAAQVSEINKAVSEIATNATEQSSALKQVNIAIGQMDQDTQKNAAMVEETTAATHSLRQEAEKLVDSVANFNITGAPSRSGRPEGSRSSRRQSAHQSDYSDLRAAG